MSYLINVTTELTFNGNEIVSTKYLQLIKPKD
jgi:hypothetical protein